MFPHPSSPITSAPSSVILCSYTTDIVLSRSSLGARAALLRCYPVLERYVGIPSHGQQQKDMCVCVCVCFSFVRGTWLCNGVTYGARGVAQLKGPTIGMPVRWFNLATVNDERGNTGETGTVIGDTSGPSQSHHERQYVQRRFWRTPWCARQAHSTVHCIYSLVQDAPGACSS